MLPIFDCSETYMIRAPGGNGRKVASDEPGNRAAMLAMDKRDFTLRARRP
jgi:hypothetical protein